jgi:hypothetical protein
MSGSGPLSRPRERVRERADLARREVRGAYPATSPPLRLAASVPHPAPISLPPE